MRLISNLFGEPKENQPLSVEEARGLILTRAYEIEAGQRALSEMFSKEKTALKNNGGEKMDQARQKYEELKSKFIKQGNFEIKEQSFTRAKNEIWSTNRDIIGMSRGEFIEWVGDNQELQNLGNNDW
jgi:hypothetical protein